FDLSVDQEVDLVDLPARCECQLRGVDVHDDEAPLQRLRETLGLEDPAHDEALNPARGHQRQLVSTLQTSTFGETSSQDDRSSRVEELDRILDQARGVAAMIHTHRIVV